MPAFNVNNNISFTYQWQVSINGGTVWNDINNGGVYNGATTSTLTISGTTVAMDGYQYRCRVMSGPCTPVFSNIAFLSVNKNYTWLGINNNWNDPLNWCPAIPGLSTDVTIPVVGTGINP